MGLARSSTTKSKLFSALIPLLAAAFGGLLGSWSDYDGILPALGGPNGVLYDLALRVSQPWRREVPAPPAVFVAVDEESLSRPELAAIPRALFQPIWARLVDGLLDGGARRIAFDVVFAYAGADFRVGSFLLPDYDRGLTDSLARGRERIVLGRFPGIPPAAPFARAVGASRVGVLDLQLESDGRIRSTGPLARLSDGRIAFGFAALAAGLSVSQASAVQRLLITPHIPLAATPTYSLGTLLDCLASPQGAARVRDAVEGRIVVIGTAVTGEDEHRGPTRFLGFAPRVAAADRCAPATGVVQRPEPERAPGALLQIAAIQAAASGKPITLAPPWVRIMAGAGLALLFAMIASRDESALTIGEHGVAPRSVILVQVVRSMATGVAGPALLGCVLSGAVFIAADLWLPLGYPILATSAAFAAILGLRWARHRALFRHLYRTAGRYLPPARLASLARSGFADPPEGEEREVSILLADLVGFTAFSNQPNRTASEVVEVANRYFSLMQVVIDRHGGCSDKFLGDAVLAFWNGLSDEPDHAVRALATAKEIIRAVNDAPGLGDVRLSMRAIVCSGRVYVGDLGARERSNFTIIGPAVNETFRLEKLPDRYGLPLLIAAPTADFLMNPKSMAASVLEGSVMVRIDDVELKGFGEPRSIYALVPSNDPGLVKFEAGREAFDQNLISKGLACMRSIDTGMLEQAARMVSERYQTFLLEGAAE